MNNKKMKDLDLSDWAKVFADEEEYDEAKKLNELYHSIMSPLPYQPSIFPSPYQPYPNNPGVGINIHSPGWTPPAPQNAGYLTPAFKWALPIEFPRGFFNVGEKFEPVMTCQNTYAFMFHTSVWKACCKPESKKFAVIWDDKVSPSIEGNKGILLIKDGPEVAAFNEWWTSYVARFEKDEWQRTHLPMIQESIEISGYPIKHNQKMGSLYGMPTVTDDLFDRWVWIVQNTEDKVIFADDYWIFKDKGELIMYKLTLDIHTEKDNDE